MESNIYSTEVSLLIDKTFKELERIEYSIGTLKKFKYSFSLFEQYALDDDVAFYTKELSLAFLEKYCEIFSNGNVTKYVQVFPISEHLFIAIVLLTNLKSYTYYSKLI